MGESIKILIVGTPGWSSDEAVRQLERAGHRAVRCQDPGDRLPCRRLRGRHPCPLDDSVDVALVLRERPHPALRPHEVGAVCALREGIPVVLTGRPILHPFEEAGVLVLDGDEDVVSACESVGQPPRH